MGRGRASATLTGKALLAGDGARGGDLADVALRRPARPHLTGVHLLIVCRTDGHGDVTNRYDDRPSSPPPRTFTTGMRSNTYLHLKYSVARIRISTRSVYFMYSIQIQPYESNTQFV